jgi:hypothetical protein
MAERTSRPLAGMRIIGYATFIDERFAPRVVPPVFSYDGDGEERLLFPPFRIEEDKVVGGAVCVPADMDRFVADEKATWIDEPLAAAHGHEMWVDSDMTPHYGPIEEVDRVLLELATGFLNAAREALGHEKAKKAMELAGRAVNADDRLDGPWEVMRDAHRLLGEDSLADLCEELGTRDFGHQE